jgi:DNA-binding MarR family transcriptional regulator
LTDFIVGEDGLLAERSIHDLAAWYGKFPTARNPLNYEAHVMLLRAYISLTAVTSGSGLSRARYNVLRILYQAPGHRLQMTEIGTGLDVSPTNVTKMVDGLTEEGLVQRVRHADDKRKTWAELTDAGVEAFEAAVPKVIQVTDSVWSELSDDEKRSLIHVLSKLRLILLTKEGNLPIRPRATDEEELVPRRRD